MAPSMWQTKPNDIVLRVLPAFRLEPHDEALVAAAPDLLAALRVARNYSLAHVATACGVTRQAVCLWEQERAVPDDRCCERLASLFGADLAPALSVRVWE